jgi:hypothetical protein
VGPVLRADPSIDLADDDERQGQLDSWLQQIALDARLQGMEGLLARYHESALQPPAGPA